MTNFEAFLKLLQSNHLPYHLHSHCQSLVLYPTNQESLMEVGADPLGSQFLSRAEIFDDRLWLSDFPEVLDKSINLLVYMFCSEREKHDDRFSIDLIHYSQEMVIDVFATEYEPYYYTANQVRGEVEYYSSLFGRPPDKRRVWHKRGLYFRVQLTWTCTKDEWGDVSRPWECLLYPETVHERI